MSISGYFLRRFQEIKTLIGKIFRKKKNVNSSKYDGKMETRIESKEKKQPSKIKLPSGVYRSKVDAIGLEMKNGYWVLLKDGTLYF